jgi:rRNA maturation protein Nop10
VQKFRYCFDTGGDYTFDAEVIKEGGRVTTIAPPDEETAKHI